MGASRRPRAQPSPSEFTRLRTRMGIRHPIMWRRVHGYRPAGPDLPEMGAGFEDSDLGAMRATTVWWTPLRSMRTSILSPGCARSRAALIFHRREIGLPLMLVRMSPVWSPAAEAG